MSTPTPTITSPPSLSTGWHTETTESSITNSQTCGYVGNSDLSGNYLTCSAGHYCNTATGNPFNLLACCSSADPTLFDDAQVEYRRYGCNYYTTCFDSTMTVPGSIFTVTTGDDGYPDCYAARHCTHPDNPYCLLLTQAYTSYSTPQDTKYWACASESSRTIDMHLVIQPFYATTGGNSDGIYPMYWPTNTYTQLNIETNVDLKPITTGGTYKTPSAQGPYGHDPHGSTAAIAGGTIGGLVALAIIAIVLSALRRRLKKRRKLQYEPLPTIKQPGPVDVKRISTPVLINATHPTAISHIKPQSLDQPRPDSYLLPSILVAGNASKHTSHFKEELTNLEPGPLPREILAVAEARNFSLPLQHIPPIELPDSIVPKAAQVKRPQTAAPGAISPASTISMRPGRTMSSPVSRETTPALTLSQAQAESHELPSSANALERLERSEMSSRSGPIPEWSTPRENSRKQ